MSYLTSLIDELAKLDIDEIEAVLNRIYTESYRELMGNIFIARFLVDEDD